MSCPRVRAFSIDHEVDTMTAGAQGEKRRDGARESCKSALKP